MRGLQIGDLGVDLIFLKHHYITSIWGRDGFAWVCCCGVK
jgi:hypothetical protein